MNFLFNFRRGLLIYRILFKNNMSHIGIIFSISHVEFSVLFILDIFSLVCFIVILISRIIYYFPQYYIDSEKNTEKCIVLSLFSVLSILFLGFFLLVFYFYIWSEMGWD